MRNIAALIAKFTLFLLFISGSWCYAAAEENQSLEEIRTAAINFASRQIDTSAGQTTIEAARLDQRLRLDKCSQPLKTSALSQRSYGANMTVVVKCTAAKPWKVYVPVKTRSYVTVVVAKRPLARGIPITAGDIVLEKREVSRMTSGYFESLDPVTGRPPKRSLSQGSVVSPLDLNIKKVISKGNRVSILAETNGISVRMPGMALSDAGKGEQIQVQNLSSQRTVVGTVIAPGIVKVVM